MTLPLVGFEAGMKGKLLVGKMQSTAPVDISWHSWSNNSYADEQTRKLKRNKEGKVQTYTGSYQATNWHGQSKNLYMQACTREWEKWKVKLREHLGPKLEIID